MADNKMLIDATHPEETRVVVLRGGRVEEFDYESAARKLLRGNIYLAKVTRVEPALQAAFVDYGGNRHGFLAFNEIHPDYYQIPMADRLELIEEEAAAAAQAEEEHAAEEADAVAQTQNTDDEHKDENEEVENQQVPSTQWDSEADAAHASDGIEDNSQQTPNVEDVDTVQSDNNVQSDVSTEDQPASPDNEADANEEPKNLSVSAAPDPKLSEPSPDTSEGDAATSVADEPQALQNDDDAQTEKSLSTPDQPSIEEQENASAIATSSDEENGAPQNIGLVEDEQVEDIDSLDENHNEAPVEHVGAEDVEEEVPSRPRRSRRHYKIQEVIKRRQILLVQVVKEERGNKGAALTTYLSLAGRYTVLMPNTARGGGVSRKISSPQDRKRMKAIAADLDVPEGMGLIIRTAGASRTKQEIRRDFEYLLRLWESVRELTLESTAPSLVYEEGNLIKRSIRDLYNKDVDEIVVAGENAFKDAKGFMRMLMPSHTRNVTAYKSPEPLFTKFQIERQLNAMFSPQVSLRSGGYLVINQTEALVAVDVNSGRSTREFSIEETALHTNLEAAEEVARQLKLRDLAGLIVIDFIDMDDRRNNRAVERRMKEALRNDRARIQVGRISHFGLMEMSRQRMRTGVLEGSTSQCAHCQGTGIVRSTESVALAVLRGLEDAVNLGSRSPLIAQTTNDVALYILNSKRDFIDNMEARLGQHISIEISDKMVGASFKVEKGAITSRTPPSRIRRTAVNMDWGFDEGTEPQPSAMQDGSNNAPADAPRSEDEQQPRRRRRRRRERRPGDDTRSNGRQNTPADVASNDNVSANDIPADDDAAITEATSASGEGNGHDNTTEDGLPKRSRRRGRRGGRRNRERREAKSGTSVPISEDGEPVSHEETGDSQESSTQAETKEDSAAQPSTTTTPEADTPDTGPQPELTTALDTEQQSDSNEATSDDAAEKKPARAPRRRRTSTKPRRSPRSRSADEELPEPTAESVKKSKTADKPADKNQPNEQKSEEDIPAYRRRAQQASNAEIEIKSVRIGGSSPESSEATAPASQPKKPSRTGWWQRRILGDD